MSRRKRSLSVGAAALALALAVGACSGFAGSSAPPIATENPYLEVSRVTLEEAKAAFDAGGAVFLDVRSESQYADSHVAGALSIPLSQLESRIGELDADDWIITYCT